MTDFKLLKLVIILVGAAIALGAGYLFSQKGKDGDSIEELPSDESVENPEGFVPDPLAQVELEAVAEAGNDATPIETIPVEPATLSGSETASRDTESKVEETKNPVIEHVPQGDKAYCSPATALMVIQAALAIDSSDPELLPIFSSLYRSAYRGGSSNMGVYGFYNILNIDSQLFTSYHQEFSSADDVEAVSLASDKLRKNVIPPLNQGKVVSLVLTSKNGRSHSLLVSDYDGQRDSFTVHDPLEKKSEDWSFDKLSKQWPLENKGIVVLCGHSVDTCPGEIVSLPDRLDLEIDHVKLAKLAIAERIVIPRDLDKSKRRDFENAVSEAEVCPLHLFWQNGREVQDVPEAIVWLKMQASTGIRLPLLFSAQPDGSINTVTICGFEGGVKSLDGRVKVAITDPTGKSEISWVKGTEVLEMGKSPREGGGHSLWVGYTNSSVVKEEGAQLESSL